ncbi:MAG: YqaA family protein [Sphaerochaetaceae bacterium]
MEIDGKDDDRLMEIEAVDEDSGLVGSRDASPRKIQFVGGSGLFKANGSVDWRQLLLKTAVLMCAFLVIYAIALYFVKDEYAEIGQWVITHMGHRGIGVFVFLVDMLIVPMSVDLVFPFVLTWNPVSLLSVMGIASALGGYAGYWIGRLLGAIPFIRRFTTSFSRDGERMIARYGVWAVVIAGLTPIPFSTVCWLAGMLKVPAGRTLLACFSRIPRMVIYYLIFTGGLWVIFR